MSRIDDELKQALAESEADAREAAASEPSEAETPYVRSSPGSGDVQAAPGRSNLGMLIALLVIAGAILMFVLGQDSKALAYSMNVTDVLSRQDELGERKLKVQGYLVEGSLRKREEPCEFRFHMRDAEADADQRLEVRYAQCIVPDTFRDVKGMPVEVTAEGQWVDGHLEASLISAKCPSKYEMQQRQLAGEEAPHAGGAPEVNPLQVIPSPGGGS